jgi:hypothetical protein
LADEVGVSKIIEYRSGQQWFYLPPVLVLDHHISAIALF